MKNEPDIDCLRRLGSALIKSLNDLKTASESQAAVLSSVGDVGKLKEQKVVFLQAYKRAYQEVREKISKYAAADKKSEEYIRSLDRECKNIIKQIVEAENRDAKIVASLRLAMQKEIKDIENGKKDTKKVANKYSRRTGLPEIFQGRG